MTAEHAFRSSKSSSTCSKTTLPVELASEERGYDVPEAAVQACQLRTAFGQNLRQARVDANLTLEVVARMSRLSEHYVSQIEAGRCDPRINTMAALALAVDRELSVLLTPRGIGVQ